MKKQNNSFEILEGHVTFANDKNTNGLLRWAFSIGKKGTKRHLLQDGDMLVIFNDAGHKKEIARASIDLSETSVSLKQNGGEAVIKTEFITSPEPQADDYYYTEVKGKRGKFVGIPKIADAGYDDSKKYAEAKKWIEMFRNKKHALLIPKK